MVDAAHLNERGFWDLVAISTAPIVATHACAHAICPATRNLTDRQLDAARHQGGGVASSASISACPRCARTDTAIRTFRSRRSPRISVIWSSGWVTITSRWGSDFDGATMPRPLKDASHLQNLIQALRAHGFDEATLRKIAFDNWMRVPRQSWR